MLALALIGGVLAFAASLPVTGPGAVLVADAALRGDPRRAVWIGLGISTPEAAYAALAYFGAGAVLRGTPGFEAAANAAAGLLLLGVAAFLWRRRPGPAVQVRESAGKAYLLGFSVVAPNPTLLVTWGTVAATVVAGGYGQPGPAAALVFGAGVGVGAALSGVALAGIFSLVRARAGSGAPRWFDRGAAVLLAVLGAVALGRAAAG